MMHKVVFTLLLFLLQICNVFGSCLIRGDFKNKETSLFVHIFQYKDGNEIGLTKLEVIGNVLEYQFPENFEEGIYRVNVIAKQFSFFDVVVMKDEKEISFEFDCYKPFDLPHINKSDINKGWYEFIKHSLDNRKAILEFSEYKSKAGKKNISNADIEKNINRLSNEYVALKSSFKEGNKNPWVNLMINGINYSGNEVEIKWQNAINEEKLIEEAMNNNKKILNTPLFKDYIQVNLVYAISVKKSNEENTKIILQTYSDTIDKFAFNDLVKKCIIRYAIIGFRENNDIESEKFISHKYNYFM